MVNCFARMGLIVILLFDFLSSENGRNQLIFLRSGLPVLISSVFVRLIFKGTHTGVFFGIPATGKSVDLDGATIVKMKDGKIASEQDFFDNMDLMTQLGLVPAQ